MNASPGEVTLIACCSTRYRQLVFDPRFPLPRRTRRLFTRLETKLPPGEEVLAAVGLSKGPPPGAETLALPIFGFMIELWVGIMTMLGISAARRSFVLAVTKDRAFLVAVTFFGRPASMEQPIAFHQIGEINDAIGDPFIELDHERYWINDLGDQLYRLRRIVRSDRSRRTT